MRISAQMCSTLPVWTTAGPSTARIFSPAAFVRFMAAAISRTVTSFGFSLETGLCMNSNRCCRAAVSAGRTRSPCRPTTMRIALADVDHGDAARRLAPGSS